ncbi:hypothetical protein SCHPADRAFT_992193 [Schizopora paradoxa]|uniref:DUF6593 domain-containing protein n=1 Tax=Schizopora paradoxa TaxID=27342 RepID=A0A0H2S830_9AGAM|nr:hypothetical protein SCHPADRAFT_992193 [Schizopora paradoxa]
MTTASLIFSHNDIRNTTLDCDSLGIHYQVVSDSGLLRTGKNTQVRRWDSRSNQQVTIAEWERHSFSSDVFKFPARGESVPVSTFMTKKRGFGKIKRSFVGDDGRRYIWRVKSSSLEAFVSENGQKGARIAKFHSRHILFGRPHATLELFPGYERTLDTLVLTFLYVEWKRRQSKRSAAAASAGAS